jgi:hypothetical protein
MPALPPERPGCPKVPGGHRPLPDPAAIRLCLVPDSAPPYDEDVSAGDPPGRMRGGARPAWEGDALAGDGGDGTRPAREGDALAAVGGDKARPVRGGAPGAPRPGATAAAAAAPPAARPPAVGGTGTGAALPWQSRFAQVLAETLAGSRPPRQIVPWTTQQARDHIQRLGPTMASVQRPRVRRVVTFRPASDVMEMAVVVGFGPRVRALAVRLERSGTRAPAGQGEFGGRAGAAGRGEPGGRWLCTAVEAA